MMSTKIFARILIIALALTAGRAWSANEIDDFSTNEAATSQGSLMTEGQTVDTINDNVRAAIARFAKHYRDTTGTTLLTTGAANAYAVTLNRTNTAYPAAGEPQWLIVAEANHTNTGAATLNVNVIGAKSIVESDGTALAGGEIVLGRFYLFQYDQGNDRFILLNPSSTFIASDGSIEVVEDDAGAVAGPTISTWRNSATPAASDLLGTWPFYGEDSAGNKELYADITGAIVDPTSTSEDGRIRLRTVIAGTLAERLWFGHGVYTPSATDGDKGADTINAKDIYDDGLPLRGTPIAIIQDQKSSGTDGGSCLSGADRTRTLNTEVFDPYNLVSISANQITLPAGTWLIKWSAPAFRVNGHQTILHDVTGASDVARGTSEEADNSTGSEGEPIQIQTRSFGAALVSPGSSNVYEIRHRCSTSVTTTGFGEAQGFGTEIYTMVEIYAG